MNSIFRDVARECCGTSGELKCGKKGERIAQGRLTGRDGTEYYGVLDRSYLWLSTPSNPSTEQAVSVCWHTVTELPLRCNEAEDFGFEISAGDDHHCFFAGDKAAQTTWLEALKSVAICTGFNSDYTPEGEIPVNLRDDNISYCRAKDGRVVAVKKYCKEKVSAAGEKLTRVMREIAILRDLAHSSVVRLLRVYEEPDSVLIVTDYVPGGDLLTRIRDKGVPTPQATKALISSLLRGIQYLHERSLIHRDIKLENVLATGNSCTIVDFGLAIRSTDDRGTICGSPGYVAPEMLRKQQYSEKVDIYSAGVVLFMLLSGATPFPGNSLSEILSKNKRASVDFSGKAWSAVPRQAKNLVLRMMEADPALRVTAAQALRHPWLQALA